MVEEILPGKSLFEMPGTYRIRVGGVLDPKWSDWLGGMTITTRESQGPRETDLVGEVTDQAGVLNALYEMHLPLLRVEFLGHTE